MYSESRYFSLTKSQIRLRRVNSFKWSEISTSCSVNCNLDMRLFIKSPVVYLEENLSTVTIFSSYTFTQKWSLKHNLFPDKGIMRPDLIIKKDLDWPLRYLSQTNLTQKLDGSLRIFQPNFALKLCSKVRFSLTLDHPET